MQNEKMCRLRSGRAASHSAFSVQRYSPAFTLTEILVVIGIIVLLLALAVPAFNLISGGKSIEGATNQFSAALGRARAQAIGLQKYTGVMFFLDPKTQRTMMAIVKEADVPPNVVPMNFTPDVYLDLDSTADFLPLPPGVSVQSMCDSQFTGTAPALVRSSDGYIGYNTIFHSSAGGSSPPTDTKVGGVILFDGNGQLTNKIYGLLMSTGQVPANVTWTAMARLLKANTSISTNSDFAYIPGPSQAGQAGGLPLRSQFGLVMFETDRLSTAAGDWQTDPQIVSGNTTGYNAQEISEESWLDQNATPLLINRYNGTLVRGQ